MNTMQQDKIKITRRAYRKLARIGIIVRLYLETITIFWLIGIMRPNGFIATVTLVVFLVIAITWLTSKPVRRLKAQYEIIDTAPIADHDYIENGDKRSHPKLFSVRPITEG